MQSLSILMLELLCPLLVSCLVPGGSDVLGSYESWRVNHVLVLNHVS